MFVLKKPTWYILVILFLIHQVLERFLDIEIPALDNHLDAFVSVPILMGLHLAEQRYFWGVRRFSGLYVVVAVVLFSVVFEFLFPWIEPRFTADWWDVVAYVLGGIYFYALVNSTTER
ncbi:MAG: hypothetical protein AAF741_02995 [Bacteroidota bacterium]